MAVRDHMGNWIFQDKKASLVVLNASIAEPLRIVARKA